MMMELDAPWPLRLHNLDGVILAIWFLQVHKDDSQWKRNKDTRSWCDHGAMVELVIFAIKVSSWWLNDNLVCVMKLMGAQRMKDVVRDGLMEMTATQDLWQHNEEDEYLRCY
ncbi:hypothetical protein V8G54_000724 [Vigna mungo]|uniref:Uncharacterized protein n=1 Tax=Vigna mungo TaxID=3915 RepID=A0AAQ3P6Y7_VIGMU